MRDSSCRRRRGFLVVLWAGLFYLLAQVAINAFIDGCKPELRSAYLLDVFRRLEQNPDTDIVCLGTSRFGLAFEEEEVQDQMRRLTNDDSLAVFNASVAAQDFHTADFVMRELLARGAHPVLVVIEISPETVARHNVWLGGHVMPPLRSHNLGLYVDEISRSLDRLPSLFSDHAFPLYRCRREIWTACAAGYTSVKRVKRTRKDMHHDAQAKFLMDGGDATQKARTIGGLATIRKWIDDYQVGGMPVWSLERLLRRCRRHGITVVLATAPVTRAHRDLYTPEIEAAFEEYVHHLEQEYECIFSDYRDAIPDNCFYDNHHLLVPQGSMPFSRRLVEEVLAPVWRGWQRSREGLMTND